MNNHLPCQIIEHKKEREGILSQLSCFYVMNKLYLIIITLLPFFIEMLQYDWLWSGHMIIKEMFYIPIKLKLELACASMMTCTKCWHCLWIVHFWLPLRFSLTFIYYSLSKLFLFKNWMHFLLFYWRKRDVLHPNKTQTRTCMCLHDDVRCKQSMA
jgi:hypothetical protein